MKLAKYLADYIEHHDDQIHDFFDNAEEIIQQGIGAFASTEGRIVSAIPKDNLQVDSEWYE